MLPAKIAPRGHICRRSCGGPEGLFRPRRRAKRGRQRNRRRRIRRATRTRNHHLREGQPPRWTGPHSSLVFDPSRDLADGPAAQGCRSKRARDRPCNRSALPRARCERRTRGRQREPSGRRVVTAGRARAYRYLRPSRGHRGNAPLRRPRHKCTFPNTPGTAVTLPLVGRNPSKTRNRGGARGSEILDLSRLEAINNELARSGVRRTLSRLET